MTIRHHPSDAALMAYAAGALDRGQRLAIETHLHGCARCRDFVRAVEQIGGRMIERLPPAAMAEDALARMMTRLDAPAGPAIRFAPPAGLDDIPGLPDSARRLRFGAWKRVGLGVHLRPIVLPDDSPTRAFLLKAAPGTRMLQHSHTALEMTCVLAGGFAHEGGRFGPGDFDFGDDQTDHQPVVDPGEDCICLVAMQGELRLSGLVGRLIQPFLRL